MKEIEIELNRRLRLDLADLNKKDYDHIEARAMFCHVADMLGYHYQEISDFLKLGHVNIFYRLLYKNFRDKKAAICIMHETYDKLKKI